LRYLFEIKDESLINAVVSSNATRSSLIEISQHLIDRIPYLTNHFKNYFGINDTHTLTMEINNREAGSIELNSLTLTNSSWQGEYFDNIPVSIEAVAKEGYVFSHWEGIPGESSTALTLSMTADLTIQAVFIAE
jgi:hypothetical protein